MPEKDITILKGLQNYQQNPPADIFDKILASVTNADDAGSKHVFGQLQQYAVQPPVTILGNTENVLFAEKKPASVKKIPAYYWYRAVAATVLIALGLWWFTKSTGGSTTEQETANHNAPVKTPPQLITPVTNDTASKQKSSNEQLVAVVKDNFINPKKAYNVNTTEPKASLLSSAAATVGGLPITITDNDVFATLINYTYNSQEQFWKEEDKELLIALNQYSSMTISEKMLALMKKMYRVKGNNKIPRSAKRAQKRLAKWKEADAMQFDSSGNKNPLDIIDLSDFFFKK